MTDAAPALLHFFVKLIAPRPDFPFTLTPHEAEAMKAHAAYWRKHMADGVVLVAGPVNEPSGAWGLGVLRVKSRDDLEAFEANDPVIQAGIGMRYEHHPMLAIMYPS